MSMVYDTAIIAVEDVVETLSRPEYQYDGTMEHALAFASDLTGISIDQLCALVEEAKERKAKKKDTEGTSTEEMTGGTA